MNCKEITDNIKHFQEVNMHLLDIVGDEKKIEGFSTEYLEQVDLELKTFEKYFWKNVKYVEIERKINLEGVSKEARNLEYTPIAISADGEKIAFQVDYDLLSIEDLATGKKISTIKLNQAGTSITHNTIENMFFGKNGKKLIVNVAYVNQSDNIRYTSFCFDTETGIESLNFDASYVDRNFVSHNYYIAGFALGSALIKDYETDFSFQIRELFDESDPMFDERIQKFAITPNGEIAVLKTAKHLIAFDLKEKKILDTQELEGEISVMEAVSGTTKFVVTHNIDTYWYDYQEKSFRTAFDGGLLTKFSVDPDGQVVVGKGALENDPLVIFDAVDKERISLISLLKSNPETILTLPNRKIALIYKDGTVMIYSSKKPKPVEEKKADNPGRLASFFARWKKN